MKIKTQLRLFLAGVILVPMLAISGFEAYHYLNRPEKMLFDGYRQIRNMKSLHLSKKDTVVMKQVMKTLPPNIDFILISHHKDILMTTFPEFEGQTQIDDETLFDHMNKTSKQYFYQIVSPPLEDTDSEIILISRVQRDQPRKKGGFEKFVAMIIFFIIIFEIFCIAFIYLVSRTITRSITLLDKNTKKIAGGELDVKLEYEKNSKDDNEITSLTENLDKMRLALKDDNERRTKFIMGISHDLRTPVALIKGYTEAMSDGMYENPDEIKKSLEIIETKTDQLETMINTLINFVKLNQTDWLQQLKKQKLFPVISEFAKNSVTTGEIFKRKVSAKIEIDENLEISFDKLLFQRSLENLFSNAIRYTSENDSVEISAVQDKIQEKNQNKKSVKIAIKDSGIGIKKEDLDKIFDLFYRATNSRREEGMGIGLSVVKTIVNAHGWDIKVSSEKDVGTEFVITIPIL